MSRLSAVAPAIGKQHSGEGIARSQNSHREHRPRCLAVSWLEPAAVASTALITTAIDSATIEPERHRSVVLPLRAHAAMPAPYSSVGACSTGCLQNAQQGRRLLANDCSFPFKADSSSRASSAGCRHPPITRRRSPPTSTARAGILARRQRLHRSAFSDKSTLHETNLMRPVNFSRTVWMARSIVWS